MIVDYNPNDILIINDDIGRPAAIISTTLDAVTSHIDPFTAGEAGCCLQNGIFCLSHDGENNAIIYDKDFNEIATLSFGTEKIVGSGIQSNRVDTFYIFTFVSSNHHRIRKVNTSGAVLQTWDTTDAGISGPCVARDSSIAYYYGNNTGAIKRYDLVNSVALTDLHAGIALEGWVCGAVDSSGNIWYTSTKTSTNEVKLRQFDTSGTILQTVVLSTGIYTRGGRSHINAADDGIWVWLNEVAGDPFFSAFKEIKFSDGSTEHFTTEITTFDHATTTGISNSCPLLVLNGTPIIAPLNDCAGGSLPGANGINDPGCNNCADSGPIDPSLPATLTALIVGAGGTACWSAGILAAIESDLNGLDISLQRGSGGNIRGRLYQGFPVPDFSVYADTNKGCIWFYTNHGLTL